MITSSTDGVLKAEYVYNHSGQQAIRRVFQPTALTIHSVFGPDGNRIAEYNEATGALIREYVWLDGAPVAVREGGVSYFVRVDHIGRPVFATNSAGAKVWTLAYLPFGGVRAATGVPTALRFPGQWFQSENGLHQNWMRDYDPTTGRYLEADPLGLVDGASIYGYVGQNPGRWSDSTGELVAPPRAHPANSSRSTEGLVCAAVSTEMCEVAYKTARDVCKLIEGKSTAARRARQRCWEQAASQYADCLASAGRGEAWPFVPPFIIPRVPRPGYKGGGRWPSVLPESLMFVDFQQVNIQLDGE